MPKITPSNIPLATSWWLSDGDEECPHCGSLYVYELEFRCTECDGPGCPHCKLVHAEGHFVCPDCVPSQAKSKGARHG
ncbi:MAG: hypothetical protein QM808_12545 [Steroidobacteraceae bacterium]